MVNMSFFGFAENLVNQIETKAREVFEDPTFLSVVSDEARTKSNSTDGPEHGTEEEHEADEGLDPNERRDEDEHQAAGKSSSPKARPAVRPSHSVAEDMEMSAADLARESVKSMNGHSIASPSNGGPMHHNGPVTSVTSPSLNGRPLDTVAELAKKKEENKRLIQSLKLLKEKMLELQAENKKREEANVETKTQLLRTEQILADTIAKSGADLVNAKIEMEVDGKFYLPHYRNNAFICKS